MANSTFGSRQLSPYMNGRSSHDLPKTPTLQRPSDASRPLPTTPKSEHRQLYKRQSSEAMQSWQKNILRMNSTLMKTNLRFDDCLILDELYGKHVISQLNRETLEKMGSRPKDQVSKFLSILERSSEDAYYLFLEVLEQDDSYRYIWQKLVDDERKYHSNLNKVETSYLTPMSTKRSEEQLHVDERRNTYVVVVSTFVPVLSERKIPTLKSKLWDLFHTVVSGDSGNYEAISGSNVPKGAADSIDDLPQGSDDLTLNAKDFLKDYFEPVETQIEKNQQLLLDTDLTDLLVEIFKTGTYFLAYNANRNLLLVENCHVKAYGDISEELWYYPTPVSPKQITVWLAEGRLKGTFYVYRSSNNDPHDPDYAVYNIGLCCNESGDVIHYRIVQNKDNELLIGDVRKNRGMKFDSIQNLVKYFRTTRGCLECRLRWSPRELTEKKVMTSTINVKQLTFQDRVASVSDQNHTSNVYKGFYAGKAVAIKVPAKPPRNKIEEADFLQEAIILGQLSHEHVAKFEGICYTRESWHIVLEYADNNDLHTCLKNDLIDYTNVRTTMNLWMQLLEALVYLRNQAYVIHRDIAARNCLIYGLEVLKLSDFGMAAKVEQHDEFIPDKGDFFSWRWAAPEVLVQRLYSTASEVWSGGVVYWEMATGAKYIPYSHLKDNSKVEKKVTSGTKLSYSEDMDKGHQEPMKSIVSRCWKKDPKERPTADELLHSCRCYLKTLDGEDNLYDNSEPCTMKKTSSFRRTYDSFKDKFKGKKKK